MNKKKTKRRIDPIESEEAYVAFLKKQLMSENYKSSVTPEEYEKQKKKYDKAKFKLKFLKETRK